jgi:hypothetical protein
VVNPSLELLHALSSVVVISASLLVFCGRDVVQGLGRDQQSMLD